MSTLNIKKFVGDFSRNLGNGIALGQNILTAVNHVIETGDTSILALMLDRAKAKKDSYSNVELTIRAIWDGVSIQTDKKTGQYRIKIKNATVSNSAAIQLAQLVADNTSVRGNKWAKAFNTETEQKPVDVKKRAEKFVKDNPELVSAYIHALQQAQKVAQNAANLEKVATDAALLAA
tara:strand:+ start:605 stop:1135 length:531 start_codon:yes stop_codon:yes gene_type:complete